MASLIGELYSLMKDRENAHLEFKEAICWGSCLESCLTSCLGSCLELAEHYATPLSTIEQEVENYKHKVENHLRRMGSDWQAVTSKCKGVIS